MIKDVTWSLEDLVRVVRDYEHHSSALANCRVLLVAAEKVVEQRAEEFANKEAQVESLRLKIVNIASKIK